MVANPLGSVVSRVCSSRSGDAVAVLDGREVPGERDQVAPEAGGREHLAARVDVTRPQGRLEVGEPGVDPCLRARSASVPGLRSPVPGSGSWLPPSPRLCEPAHTADDHAPDRVARGCSGRAAGRQDVVDAGRARTAPDPGRGRWPEPSTAPAPAHRVAASWRRVAASGVDPGRRPTRAAGRGRAGAPPCRRAGWRRGCPRLTAGARARSSTPASCRGHRHRGPGALAGRQRRGTPDGRPARLRRRLGLDRGQRRHQRDRHRPGPRRGRADPAAPSTSSSRTPSGAAPRHPLRGPVDRRTLGVVDVSGPSRAAPGRARPWSSWPPG